MTKHLSATYQTLHEAEEALEIDYFRSTDSFTCDYATDQTSTPKQSTTAPNDNSMSPIFSCSPSKDGRPLPSNVGDLVKDFIDSFKSEMSPRLRTQLISYLLKVFILESDGLDFFRFVNADFLQSSLSAMKTLFHSKKHNLIYFLSKCFQDPTPRLPLNQMPCGLLDYNIRFFAKGSTQNLGMEEHYASWLETMFVHFGHKWACLHRGPAWQYEVDNTNGTEEDPLPGNLSASSPEMTEEIDIVQSALLESSLCLNDQNLESDTLVDINRVSQSLENSASEDVVHVSHLWARVSDSQQQEMELGLVSPQEMEQHHRIQPTNHKTRRNPWMYDPLKVCFTYIRNMSRGTSTPLLCLDYVCCLDITHN